MSRCLLSFCLPAHLSCAMPLAPSVGMHGSNLNRKLPCGKYAAMGTSVCHLRGGHDMAGKCSALAATGWIESPEDQLESSSCSSED